ncbi:hypothetical protein [Amycolatopsis sp. NPDC004625]|uniref:hypothetical protein n=1 Tax=Amycolatopsis sp. NPDC004625 TaxID=3154670 RepID=UPI0033BD94F4
MSEPTPSGSKTLGVKLDKTLHSQLTMVAQLDGVTLGETILDAIRAYIESKRADGTLATRAAEALAEIEREAADRRKAIEALFEAGGDPAEATTEEPGKPARRRNTPSS